MKKLSAGDVREIWVKMKGNFLLLKKNDRRKSIHLVLKLKYSYRRSQH